MLTANNLHRFTLNRLGHATTSDLMAKLDNVIETMPIETWSSISKSELNNPNRLPDAMVLAATGKQYEEAIKSTIEKLENNEFSCSIRDHKFTHVRIYDCLRQTLKN